MSPAPLKIMYSRPTRYAVCLSPRRLIQVTPRGRTDKFWEHQPDVIMPYISLTLVWHINSVRVYLGDNSVTYGWIQGFFWVHVIWFSHVETLEPDSGLHSIFAVQKISSMNNNRWSTLSTEICREIKERGQHVARTPPIYTVEYWSCPSLRDPANHRHHWSSFRWIHPQVEYSVVN